MLKDNFIILQKYQVVKLLLSIDSDLNVKLFYNQIIELIYKLLVYIPALEYQMSGYFDTTGQLQNEINIFTVFKGLPFFIITIYAIINRKSLYNKIKNYDKYILLSIVCSLTYLMSLYMYWTWRFGVYCLFPVFSFFSQIVKYHTNSKEKNFVCLIVMFLLLFITIRYLIQCFYTYGGIF